MILSDREIRKMMKKGTLRIDSISPGQIQPASVDIRLGNSFTTVELPESEYIRLDSALNYKTAWVDNEYILYPGRFVLATTREYFKLPNNLTAFVEGRSSIGRLGLFVQNAGWVDPGFEGEITLELFNASDRPIVLLPGTRIAQMVFAKTRYAALNPYCGKYQGQTGATGSMIYKDFSKSEIEYPVAMKSVLEATQHTKEKINDALFKD